MRTMFRALVILAIFAVAAPAWAGPLAAKVWVGMAGLVPAPYAGIEWELAEETTWLSIGFNPWWGMVPQQPDGAAIAVHPDAVFVPELALRQNIMAGAYAQLAFHSGGWNYDRDPSTGRYLVHFQPALSLDAGWRFRPFADQPGFWLEAETGILGLASVRPASGAEYIELRFFPFMLSSTSIACSWKL